MAASGGATRHMSAHAPRPARSSVGAMFGSIRHIALAIRPLCAGRGAVRHRAGAGAEDQECRSAAPGIRRAEAAPVEQGQVEIRDAVTRAGVFQVVAHVPHHDGHGQVFEVVAMGPRVGRGRCGIEGHVQGLSSCARPEEYRGSGCYRCTAAEGVAGLDRHPPFRTRAVRPFQPSGRLPAPW